MWDSHGRENAVSRSIHHALTSEPYSQDTPRRGCLMYMLHVFSLGFVKMSRMSAELFQHLRNEVWDIDDTEYTNAFRRHGPNTWLVAVGDLGYSGSVILSRIAFSSYDVTKKKEEEEGRMRIETRN